MAGVQGLMRVGKKALHFALLVFTAFWLVATSAPRKAARDCFVPLKRDTLALTLGKPVLASHPDSPPSCQAIDGLSEGAVVRVRLTRDSKRPEVKQGACWGYDVSRLEGPLGITNVESLAPDRSFYGDGLFDASAAFTAERCSGRLQLGLAPGGPIGNAKLLDVVHPTSGDDWRVRRLIRSSQDQGCKALSLPPSTYCEDTFELRSAVYAP